MSRRASVAVMVFMFKRTQLRTIGQAELKNTP